MAEPHDQRTEDGGYPRKSGVLLPEEGGWMLGRHKQHPSTQFPDSNTAVEDTGKGSSRFWNAFHLFIF